MQICDLQYTRMVELHCLPLQCYQRLVSYVLPSQFSALSSAHIIQEGAGKR